MDSYTGFAEVYDVFMDQTPYQQWKNTIVRILKEHGIEDGLVLDLGCGTGTLTELMAQEGYDMIGVDQSQEMLQIATAKKDKSKSDILYLCQDMREFELFGTVRTILCTCDSLNYLTEPDDVEDTFRLVNNYLDPGGLFIFDFNTVYKYENIGDTTIAENREDCSFIWENYYYPDEYVNEYDITFFVREEKDCYRKFTESHYQRGYTLEEIQILLERAGLQLLKAYDGDTDDEVTEQTERVFVIARERGKENAMGETGI